jgi:hypothetical protein
MTETVTEPEDEGPRDNESVEGPVDSDDPTLDPAEGRVGAEEDDGSEALEHGGGGNG